MMITVKMYNEAGKFAENKEIAKTIRTKLIIPNLENNNMIVFDFNHIEGCTQSFIHALLSKPIRDFRETAFNNLLYQNADQDVKKIISIVYRYMQESLDE